MLSFSASLSSQQAKAAGPSLNLSRASPFGSLSQISSRRTFAYLIATLNASHPDYDFSYLLRPSDFKREKSLKRVINTLDTTLYNLRPQSTILSSTSSSSETQNASMGHLDESSGITSPSSPSANSSGSGERWNPRMWHLIDQEMSLKECSLYAYTPEEDPYDGEEGALWSFNYFFFNKAKKRVCYLYLRGVSNIDIAVAASSSSSSFWANGLKTPLSSATTTTAGTYSGAATPAGPGGGGVGRPKRGASGTWSISSAEMGRKRACYWLGDRAGDAELVGGEDEEEEDVDVADYEEVEHVHADEEEEEGEGEGEDRHFTSALSSTDDARSESPCKGRATTTRAKTRASGGGSRAHESRNRNRSQSRTRSRSGSSTAVS